ncbi:MAG: Asp-tRNA(Asn)/Glu-tRNA(Gln) amidotransferase subunit GatA [Brachymonas sp.]|nr:Asp-tRNA(Asn)/Glu-tRNA(Gln) amidotransferase subunit GatA [Brachymonas sp.]
MSDLHLKTVAELSHLLQSKQASSVELAQHFLQRSQQHSALGAYLAIDEQATLEQAKAADARIAAGKATALTGVPIAHKDAFVTRGWPTTAGSKMLQGYQSPFDATVVAKLGLGNQEQGGSDAGAGMVTLGKLNCDEFAMGNGSELSAYGKVHNPWDTSRVPGGSSGGSAAAVAAGLTPCATGTDTGGSIRQPASFCGITGIKPTYGRASRYGVIAYASSLDQAGPMAHTAEDCALLLSTLCGPDLDRDSTSLDVPAEDYTAALNQPLAGLRVGLPKEFFGKGMADDVRAAVDAALKEYEKLGAQLVDITLPHSAQAVPVYYIIGPAEASSNLSRFDGVNFGHRSSSYTDLESMYQASRSEAFGLEVKRRILTGAYVLSHGYYDAYYLKAQQIRRLIAEDFQLAFKECDVIAGPVSPTVAWQIGAHADVLSSYMADIFTLPASLAGLPGMSLPVGVGEGNMPVGLQLIGNYLQEGRLLNTAHAFQQATDWHTRRPQGF